MTLRSVTAAMCLSAVLLGGVSPGVLAAAGPGSVPKHQRAVPPSTLALMKQKGMAANAPILVRIFKKESELEVWKLTGEGDYALLKTFPICRWSGRLGPKTQQGDRQAPEGFYAVTPRLMNPNSSYYLSFDTGYPNAYDRAHGATGSALMVHGACSSAGCFAMTDEGIAEIYALARDAFSGGQKAFQVQAFPFRMTAENLVRHRSDPNIGFWRQLKEGSDRFEAIRREPVVSVTAGQYTFKQSSDRDAEAQIATYRAQEQDHMAVLLEEGRPSVRTTYEDGGQHPTFAALVRRGLLTVEVSRPETLSMAGREIVLAAARPARPTVQPKPIPVQVAAVVEQNLPEIPGPSHAEPSLFAAVPVGGSSSGGFIEARPIPGSYIRLAPHLLVKQVTLASM
jgi:murein L,D-transpeptidase YafK